MMTECLLCGLVLWEPFGETPGNCVRCGWNGEAGEKEDVWLTSTNGQKR